jgi:hypothetical protein
MTEQREEHRISRRTIAKGAAWAIPAVPLVVATPAYAASGGGPTVVIGAACKYPGNSCSLFVKGYVFEVSITNTTDKDIYIYNQSGYELEVNDDSTSVNLSYNAAVYASGPLAGQEVVFPVLLEPGETILLIVNGQEANSANLKGVTVTVSVPWGHTPVPPDPDNHPNVTDSVKYASTPPDQGAKCDVTVPGPCAA